MVVLFSVNRDSLGSSQIRELTLNMSLVHEDGTETQRQEYNPKILHYGSDESSLSLANRSADSAFGNLRRPNFDDRNFPYEADQSVQSVSWLSETTSNPSRERDIQLQIIRRDRIARNNVRK